MLPWSYLAEDKKKTNISTHLYTLPIANKQRKPAMYKAYNVDYLSNSYRCLLVHLKAL
jgi:hypothetical protein